MRYSRDVALSRRPVTRSPSHSKWYSAGGTSTTPHVLGPSSDAYPKEGRTCGNTDNTEAHHCEDGDVLTDDGVDKGVPKSGCEVGAARQRSIFAACHDEEHTLLIGIPLVRVPVRVPHSCKCL
jgi:hypothetical protein